MTAVVGGVRCERPFRVRRLGHFGINCVHQSQALRFYTRLLGLKVSDVLPFGKILPPEKQHLTEGDDDATGYFTRYGSDHHSFVIFPKKIRDGMGGHAWNPDGVIVNQITWQVGSLEEVVKGDGWFRERGETMLRSGRDMPGSNWHTYLRDPDGHVNELYYGIEQIGWSGYSKPAEMHGRGFHDVPELPQMAEQEEVSAALANGVPLDSGTRYIDEFEETYDVDGVQLPRPFKITGIGPVRLFTPNLDAMVAYYRDTMGLRVTTETEIRGHRAVFLRSGTEHHSLALYDMALRDELNVRADSTLLSFGFRVASYRQLRDAATYLLDRGVELADVPGDLFPGMDYSVNLRDPDGQLIQLYYAMEQIGWGGRPDPDGPKVATVGDPRQWPEVIDGPAALFDGEPFMGPWG